MALTMKEKNVMDRDMERVHFIMATEGCTWGNGKMALLKVLALYIIQMAKKLMRENGQRTNFMDMA